MVTIYYPVRVVPRSGPSEATYQVLVTERGTTRALDTGSDIIKTAAVGLAEHISHDGPGHEFALDFSTPFDVWGDSFGFSDVKRLSSRDRKTLEEELAKALRGE